MKPTRERMDLASYPSKVDVPPRFSDVDMFKHINNVAIGQFYEEVRFSLTADLRKKLPREKGGAVIVANVDIAYLRQGQYPGMVTVGSGVVQRGRKSYIIGQALFQNGACISTADTTLVYMENGVPAALAPEFDEVFAALQLPGFVDER
jgi:acyl-CoA thioester hydrolase